MGAFPPAAARQSTVASLPGGYRRIPTLELFNAWHAYRTERRLRYFDFRLYLALHEIQERRAAASRKMRRRSPPPPRLGMNVTAECARLLGVADLRAVRGGFRRLERAGFVRIGEALIGLDGGTRKTETGTPQAWAARVGARRTVVIPRRVLRSLVLGGATAEAATLLGHLFRCVFFHRDSGWRTEGSCSVKFIAVVFGVDPRSVKRARRRLCDLGWLATVQADHWHVQAHGARIRVVTENLGTGPAPQKADARLSPPKRPPTTRLSPPESKRTLLADPENQTLERRAGVGKRIQATAAPTLRRLSDADLADPSRLLQLLPEAQACGWLNDSENDRLRLLAAAEHAKRVATANPCGLFLTVLRDGLWSFISNLDEESARTKLACLVETGIQRGSPTSRQRVAGSNVLQHLIAGVAAACALPRKARQRPDSWPLRCELSPGRAAQCERWPLVAETHPPDCGFGLAGGSDSLTDGNAKRLSSVGF